MKDKRHQVAAIAALTEAAFAASQARMGALKRREAELRDKIDALGASSRSASQEDGLDPAARAGADLLWQRWVEGRRSKLNVELANTLVAQAQAKDKLAKDFGRHEAAKDLRRQHEVSARADALRRAERFQ